MFLKKLKDNLTEKQNLESKYSDTGDVTTHVLRQYRRKIE